MKVIDIINQRRDTLFSVEVIPPRNGGDIKRVYDTVERIKRFGISFISVTYGSGGSLRGGTEAIASLIKEKYNIDSVVHLTCTGVSKNDIENTLMLLKYLGLENVLALRGDPPWGEKRFIPHTDGHQYAYQLIEQIQALNQGKYFLRPNDREFFKLPPDAEYREGEKTDFCVGAACYIEGHPESPDIITDRECLKIKVDKGADYLISQMIFSADLYSDFLQKINKLGITVPVIPGIMPLSSYSQINMMQNMFHVSIPRDIIDELSKYKDDREKFIDASVEITTGICRELLKKQVPCIHFYSLNRGEFTAKVLEKLI